MTHEEKQRCIELRYKKSRTPEEENEFNLLLTNWAKEVKKINKTNSAK